MLGAGDVTGVDIVMLSGNDDGNEDEKVVAANADGGLGKELVPELPLLLML